MKNFISNNNPEVSISVEKYTRQDDFDNLSLEVQDLKKKGQEMKNPTMYVFVNKSLMLDPGKAAAQATHAQEELIWEILNSSDEERERYKKILNQNPRTVIILEAKDSDELYKICNYLESCGLRAGVYVDEKGENYLLEPTAMAVEYVDKTDPRIELIFRNFNLYSYVDPILSEIKDHWWWNRDRIFASKVLDDIARIYKRRTGKEIDRLSDD